MFERFDKQVRVVIVDARSEALIHADARLEAEHLLLALARRSQDVAGRVLAGAGLDHDRLRGAIDADVERTLDAVGVSTTAIRMRSSSPLAGKEPRFGASAKRALERAVRVAQGRGDRHLVPTHVLIGILGATEGTVPRVLRAAGVDVGALVTAARDQLGAAN